MRRAAELGDQSSQDELIGELSRSDAEEDRAEPSRNKNARRSEHSK
jgi:hypothetical protein